MVLFTQLPFIFYNSGPPDPVIIISPLQSAFPNEYTIMWRPSHDGGVALVEFAVSIRKVCILYKPI